MKDHIPFENRLTRMFVHHGKWARRQGITCFRTYDDDMPDYPFSIDIYEKAVYVAEYQRNHGMSEEDHNAWLDACLEVISKVLRIPLDKIFLRTRQQQKGSEQYERMHATDQRFLVQESGHDFWVNLQDYLDTGLFLDHRKTRSLVQEMAEGKRFLNLFAYTGSFTVYAAKGGAKSTTTIDMSKTYLNWAIDNMKINGFHGTSHQFLQEDVKQWLPSAADESFDLIVIDPPTFSNSKRMDDVLDVQRDHVEMLNHCLRLLAPGGKIWFSTNYRKFKLDSEKIDTANIKNTSNQTLPNDFRDRKIHQSWLLEK